MYSRFLRVRLPVFLLSGAVLALLAGSNILLHRNIAEIGARLDDMNRITRNRGIMRKETELLKQQIGRVNAYVPSTGGSASYREVLLSGLDHIRSQAGSGHLAYSNIQDGAEPLLPLVISFEYANYFQVVKLLDQLERVRFPFFDFKSFSFEKTGAAAAECKVTGGLVTRSGEI